MGLSEDIKQKNFKSEYSKALVNIFYTNAWLNQRYDALFKSKNLTRPQFNVLRILRGQYPTPATVNLIIDRMIDKSSNASRIVDKLESKGLVIRQPCADDRRAVDVIISSEGLKLLEDLDGEMNGLEQQLNNLSDRECEELNHLLDKLRS